MKNRINEAKWIESRQRWQINVQSEGARRTFTSAVPGPKGKIEAEKKADKWIAQKTTKDTRFNLLWDKYIEEVKLLNSSGTHKKYEQIGRLWLLPEVGHRRLSSISNGDWQTCINNAYAKGKSKKSLESIRGVITAVYAYAKKNRAPLERPEDIAIPKDAKVGEKKILQPNDIKMLFAVDTITHYKKEKPCFYIYAWRFLVLAGLRRGELAGLQKGDIKDGVLYIRRAINEDGETTKGKSNAAIRYIVLNGQQNDVLSAQLNMLKSKGIVSKWLFPAQDGDMSDPNAIYKAWLTYRKQHGIKSSIHEMRHTTISIAQADVPEQLLKRMVGHTRSMDTFGVYGHDVDGEMKRASKLLEDAFKRILE